jgi:serine/threonine-protein kinase HipA
MDERNVTVFIYLPGETVAVPAGIFTHHGDSGVGAFAYGQRYIERHNALPVDPIALPLGLAPREVTSNGGLYGAFRDAAPDYWGRLVIAADAGAPQEALSEIDFLLAANATRVGNLDFRSSPENHEPKLGPPHFNDLAQIIQAAQKLTAGETIETRLLKLLRQGSSMGGARPKCTVEWQNALWIAKFSAIQDTLNIPRIEFATMELARRCGITVPEIRLVSVGENDIFLSRRFDRERGRSGWLKLGFLSALSFMKWDEGERHLWDYAAIADVMRRYIKTDDIQELYRRMVFNMLVRNTDDHPRNHGFLVDDGKMSLSSAYDIVPTPARFGVNTKFRLAMSVGERGREANLENALSRSSRYGLSKEHARAIVQQLLETISGWREHYEECGVSRRQVEFLAPSFAIGDRDRA